MWSALELFQILGLTPSHSHKINVCTFFKLLFLLVKGNKIGYTQYKMSRFMHLCKKERGSL